MSDRLTAKLKSPQSALILAALGVSAAALIWRYTTRKKRDQRLEAKKPDDLFSPSADGKDVAMVKEAMEAMQKSFDEAVLSIRALPENVIGQNDRLMVYGLYKQASVGNRNIAEPSKLNIVAHAKWTAWGKFTGLPKEVAKIQYIEVAKHFVGGAAAGGEPVDDNADIIYDDGDESWTDDEEEDEAQSGEGGQTSMSSGGMSGMGLRPSKMEFENDSENDEADGGTVVARLQRAAQQENITALKKAVSDIGDTDVINKADDSGQTALHFAADRGSSDCVSLLLEAGANPNAADSDGISVLQTAVIGGSVETVRLLLKAGANPDHKDIDGETPRSCAEEDGSEEMKKAFNTDI